MEDGTNQPERDARADALRHLFTDRVNFRADCRLVMQAIRDRWPIPRDVKTIIPARLTAILVDPAATRREQLRAGELFAAILEDNERDILAQVEAAPGN